MINVKDDIGNTLEPGNLVLLTQPQPSIVLRIKEIRGGIIQPGQKQPFISIVLELIAPFQIQCVSGQQVPILKRLVDPFSERIITEALAETKTEREPIVFPGRRHEPTPDPEETKDETKDGSIV